MKTSTQRRGLSKGAIKLLKELKQTPNERAYGILKSEESMVAELQAAGYLTVGRIVHHRPGWAYPISLKDVQFLK